MDRYSFIVEDFHSVFLAGFSGAPRTLGLPHGCLWQTSAAIVARFADAPGPEAETNPEIGESTLTPADLTHRAIEHGDEHAIKFTEACLREDAIRPDPVYRVAAEAVFHRLKPMSR